MQLKHAHPFKFREAPGGPDAPRRIERILSLERTAMVVKYAKSQGWTVNHLGTPSLAISFLICSEDAFSSCGRRPL
jgi:hypothetical protein